MKTRSPHGVIVGNLAYDEIADAFVPNISTQTHQESVSNIKVDIEDMFLRTGCVGLESMFRPFTLDPENLYLPFYDINITGAYFPANKITSQELNPYQNGCDLLWALAPISGEYLGLKVKNLDMNYAAPIALKGPIPIQAWGYDIAGNPVPNSGNLTSYGDIGISGLTGMIPNVYGPLNSSSASFYPGYLRKSIFWPTGPLDIRWDKIRSVWTSPGMILCGQTDTTINPGGTGLLNIYINDKPTNELVFIKNFFKGASANINSGVNMVCGYDPFTNVWRPIAVDC
jgi:hypothetical protein